MQDSITRFLIEDIESSEPTESNEQGVPSVRGELVQLDSQWQAMLKHVDYPVAVQKILGEAVAATLLLAETIKFNGSLTLQVRSQKAISLLVVQANADNTVRGMANYTESPAEWDLNADDLSLQTLMGGGQMVITIEMGEGMADYQGIVPLEGEKLQDAIGTYFEQSEQLPTYLWLCEHAGKLAGMLVQKLPNESREQDEDLWHRTYQLASTIKDDELLNLDKPTILHRLFHEEDVRVFEDNPITFKCNCSREKTQSVLKSIGKDEAMAALEEQGNITVQCQFCNASEVFDAVDVYALFSEMTVHTQSNANTH